MLRGKIGPVGAGIPKTDCRIDFSDLRPGEISLPVPPDIIGRFDGNSLSFSLRARLSPKTISGRIRGLDLIQPSGLGGGYFLKNGGLDITLPVESFSRPPVRIRECGITGAGINLVKKGPEASTIAHFFPKSSPRPAPSPSSAKEAPAESSLLVEKCLLKNLTFSYRDRSLENGELMITVRKINGRIADVALSPPDTGRRTFGTLLLTARLDQDARPDGYMGLDARFGTLGSYCPDLAAVLLVIGLRLEPLEPILPSGAATTLGGAGVDLLADVALCPRLLSAGITVRSSGGHTFSLPVNGPPAKPVVDNSGVLYDLLARTGGGVGNLVGNLPSASWRIAEGAFGTIAALGKGFLNTVGAFGEGIYGIGKGAVEGDLAGMGGGLYRATGGPIREAAGGLFAAGGEVLGGISGAGSTAWGSGDWEDWKQGIPDRWEEGWKKVRQLLDAISFPPRPDSEEEKRGEQ